MLYKLSTYCSFQVSSSTLSLLLASIPHGQEAVTLQLQYMDGISDFERLRLYVGTSDNLDLRDNHSVVVTLKFKYSDI